MATAVITKEQLRAELCEALKPYGLEVDTFLKSDLDEHSDSNLRDMWLICRGIIQ